MVKNKWITTKSICTRICVFLIALIIYPSAFSQTYGLKFNGADVPANKRTGIDLTPNDFLKFSNEFEISFQIKTTQIEPDLRSGLFGYVFRMINENNENIDLLLATKPNIEFKLVVAKTNTIVGIKLPEASSNDWLKLNIEFLLAEDRIVIHTPDTLYVQENIGLKNQEHYKIFFGANNYKQFKNSIVPYISIKDILIKEKGKRSYHWPLNEGEGNIGHDKVQGKQAIVLNPEWLIPNHQKWELNYQKNINGFLLITADTDGEKIFILSQDTLYTYHAKSNTVIKKAYYNKPVFINKKHRAVYNNIDKRIYCYFIDKRLAYALDPEKAIWDKTGENFNDETGYYYHNAYFNNSDTTLYLFGGYGHFDYKSIIWKVNLANNNWKMLPCDRTIFTPRHFAGLGALNDTIYMLGGFGSPSGSQLVNPHSYFDMFGYSIKNRSFFKKFEIPHLIDDMIIGHSLEINPNNRDYYALISSMFSSYDLYLIKGNLDHPEVQLVGDKIEKEYRCYGYYTNLYHMPIQSKLFVPYTSLINDSVSQISIHSINCPPNISDIKLKKTPEIWNLIIYIMVICIIIAGISILIYFKTYKKYKSINFAPAAKNAVEIIKKAAIQKAIQTRQHKYDIIFFGGFQVFNKTGSDITNKFSPLLKELFLLIFLHTLKNNKGISAGKIIEVFWQDKPLKKAQNSRAANIHRLRSILEEVGNCELSSKTGYWKIEFNSAEIRTDYTDFLSISNADKKLTKENIEHLLRITSKGPFLLNIDTDWLDDFKSSVSDVIIELLISFAKSCNINSDAIFIVKLVDTVFNFDIINEEGMILKCKSLYYTGNHSMAKLAYQKYVEEYKNMFGQDYKKSFPEILEI